MTIQESEISLSPVVDAKWRSAVEERLVLLRKNPTIKKCEECIEEILSILREAIIQDRKEVALRLEKRRENYQWWFKFIGEIVGGIVSLLVGGYFLFEICRVVRYVSGIFRTMPKDELLNIWKSFPELFNGVIILCVILLIILVLMLVGGKELVKFFSKIIRNL